MKTYQIGEAARLMNLSISTLRYYDKEGLLESVERTEGGIRIFKEKDIQQLRMVECLKNTGMQLKDIRTFFQWCREGDSTLQKRYQMFQDRRRELEAQMQALQNSLDLVNYKCEYYRLAAEEGNTENEKVAALQECACKNSSYVKTLVGD